MGIEKLRRWAPRWSWAAKRRGFGWEYVGSLGDRKVVVYAVSRIVGYHGDDFETQWLVADGTVSLPFSSWWITQEAEQENK